MSEDDSFYIALKFKAGELDTTDGRSGYRYKPGARMYPKRASAAVMRRRWIGEGYEGRLARFWVDENGAPQVEWADLDENIVPACRMTKTRAVTWGTGRMVTNICVLDEGHDGTHSTTRTRSHYSVFRADGETT